jgi:hypothetical protein
VTSAQHAAKAEEPVTLTFTDAQRIFDLAVGADNACSGYMDLDDVHAMRRLAVTLGVDPATCTGEEFTAQFPHPFHPGRPDLAPFRRTVSLNPPDTANARHVSVTRPESDAEVIARLGGTPDSLCDVGPWSGRCGKTADDPIHQPEETA